MAFKSINEIPELQKKSNFYYDPKFESVVKGVEFGDDGYQLARDRYSKILTDLNGLTPDQASDFLDAYITKVTHYAPNKLLQKPLRRKVGKFETGNDWNDSQAAAQKLLDSDPNAVGVLYGLRYEDEQPQGQTGLKNPLLLYGDDFKNISDAFSYGGDIGKKSQKFQFDTLYR